MPLGTIRRFVSDKSKWINRNLEQFKSLKRIDNIEGYSDGDTIILFGRDHKLRLAPAAGYFVRLGDNNTIEAGFRNDRNPVLIKAMIEDWFKVIARQKLTQKFHEIISKYSDYRFSPAGFVVRKMKKRWGSCSSKGKIAISYDLVRLDVIFAEYVIIHELCHLKHHNHSSDYYNLLSEVYPDWKKIRKELQQFIR